MAGVIYGGITINGDRVDSCISYEYDFMHTSNKDEQSTLFARIEIVNQQLVNDQYTGGQLAIVSYDNKDGEASCYNPIRSKIINWIDVSSLSGYMFLEQAINDLYSKKYGSKENGEKIFQQEIELLLYDTAIDIQKGIMHDEHGTCKYVN